MQTKYLIIGSSHAGLSAADEIRVHDQKGTLTMISMENCLPYSPTILPYIVEGKVEEKNIYLRDEKYFKDNKINYLRGKKVIQVSTKTSKVTLDDGSEIGYKKLLVATGSEPTLPPTPGRNPGSGSPANRLCPGGGRWSASRSRNRWPPRPPGSSASGVAGLPGQLAHY